MKRRTVLTAMLAASAPGIPWALARAADPLKVGFIYLGPVGDAGYAYQMDLGRQALEKNLGAQVAVRAVPNTNEGPDSERVARELTADGCKLIFAASFGYMNPVLKVAKRNPGCYYTVGSGYLTAPNFGGYNAKWHEGSYLSGIVAGKMTKSNVIGYVAPHPVPDVMWAINGFILGARSVNPKAEVRVIFVNSWYDPGKEREAALVLMNLNADVMTHFTDTPSALQAAEEKGVWAISFHSDMSKYAPTKYLTGLTHNWGDFFTQTAKNVMAGTQKGSLYFGGIKEGVVKMAPFGPGMPADVAALVRAKEQEIASGKLNVFAGPIKDQAGTVRVAAGSVYPEAQLGKMDWFAEGVISSAKK
ncbi:MAG: BMP family ABC transporter substrate-binding protein [Burkholderiaceae bacterium]